MRANMRHCQPWIDVLPPAALPGAKLLEKFDQNFLLPFGRSHYLLRQSMRQYTRFDKTKHDNRGVG
jgi:hypothetical protein